jgi:hypothetical protein
MSLARKAQKMAMIFGRLSLDWTETPVNRFPIPSSGAVQIIPRSVTSFDIVCREVNSADKDRLMEFFSKMAGRSGSFRFEYGDTSYSECHFESDTRPATSGTAPHDLTFPITALRAQLTSPEARGASSLRSWLSGHS